MKDSQLSARIAGMSQCFLDLLLQWLAIDVSLSFKTVWKASVVVLSRYRFKRSSNFMPKASTLLAWADVRVGFPSALMRVVALMVFFCSIHSFLCNYGGITLISIIIITIIIVIITIIIITIIIISYYYY